jgi:hypothetical protein
MADGRQRRPSSVLAGVMKSNSRVSDYINPLPSPHKEIGVALRDMIHDTFPYFTEEFKWNYPAYYYKNKRICSLGAFKNHVNLEFDYGSSLTDSKGRVEGVGENIRHVKIRALEEVGTEYFADLLRQSIKIIDNAPRPANKAHA